MLDRLTKFDVSDQGTDLCDRSDGVLGGNISGSIDSVVLDRFDLTTGLRVDAFDLTGLRRELLDGGCRNLGLSSVSVILLSVYLCLRLCLACLCLVR